MPELAEVEYYRQQWRHGLKQRIQAVKLNAGKRIFRGTDATALQKALRGSTLLGSEAHGKQLLFRFSKGGWLGIHLGMTGKLRVDPAGAASLKHDHLVLRQSKRSLVFSDPRQFGRVLFHLGKNPPPWWADRPAAVLSPAFTLDAMKQFLSRHERAPIKAVLLLQSGFPGIGNWMADEILWQSKIHPGRPTGGLLAAETKRLRAKVQHVCREALRAIGDHDGDLPPRWLFHHRWRRGGHCPADGTVLQRGQFGGRTTCWCPSCQTQAT
ncbi:MAG TPA: DNA-formamidopyrimidine glycosylase family protein [Candidatus Saccharimonadales bacterium]|nr:DNA-formamidopyrimidine glycosylase family protein [Candidatus Saccharimonadales bacterium]